MSKIKVGLPSKGRIQEEMNNFLTSAGIDVKKDGGQRTYVGSFSNFEGFEIRFLSANEIAKELNSGNLHLGLTGLDLIRELDSKDSSNVNCNRKCLDCRLCYTLGEPTKQIIEVIK